MFNWGGDKIRFNFVWNNVNKIWFLPSRSRRERSSIRQDSQPQKSANQKKKIAFKIWLTVTTKRDSLICLEANTT